MDVAESEEPHDAVACRGREDDLSDAGQDGHPPDALEVGEAHLDADQEQQEGDADLAQGVERLGVLDVHDADRADQEAGRDVAEDGRLAEQLGEGAEDGGHHDDEADLEEEVVHRWSWRLRRNAAAIAVERGTAITRLTVPASMRTSSVATASSLAIRPNGRCDWLKNRNSGSEAPA